MSSSLQNLITNKLDLISDTKYTAIIGINPSEGARSPKLWNKVFKEYLPKIKMVCLDVEKQNIYNLLKYLENDLNFLGGAIAAPYKENVFDYLNLNYDIQVGSIKAVNNISRDSNYKLYGHNTDGLASIESFKNKFNLSSNSKILILGYGGVGKAVASFFSHEMSKFNQKISVISNKNLHNNKKIEKNISFYNWDHLKELIPSNNVIVNCTTLGWGEYENISPIEEKLISKASQNSVFFDVIYQPKETLFLRYCRERGYETMNGEDMNFIQAVLAFNNTIKMFDKKISKKQIIESMLSI